MLRYLLTYVAKQFHVRYKTGSRVSLWMSPAIQHNLRWWLKRGCQITDVIKGGMMRLTSSTLISWGFQIRGWFSRTHFECNTEFHNWFNPAGVLSKLWYFVICSIDAMVEIICDGDDVIQCHQLIPISLAHSKCSLHCNFFLFLSLGGSLETWLSSTSLECTVGQTTSISVHSDLNSPDSYLICKFSPDHI